MGNDSSVMVKHAGLIGPMRKMSKAQSSVLLSDMTAEGRRQHSEDSSSSGTLPSCFSQSESGNANVAGLLAAGRRTSGAYVKKQQKNNRRKPPQPLISAVNIQEPADNEKGGESNDKGESHLCKRGSTTSSSRGSQDSSSEGIGFGAENIIAGEENGTRTAWTGEEEVQNGNGGFHSQQHLPHLINPPLSAGGKCWLLKHRKESVGHSANSGGDWLPASNCATSAGGQQKRHRSASLCTAQMKADCQQVAALTQQTLLMASNNNNNINNYAINGGRKGSSAGAMPSLTRLRIQHCFRNAKPAIGHNVLKRASTVRPDFKAFLAHQHEDKVDELARDIYALVTDCVANVELPAKVAANSFAFGEMHAQLCNVGFRPDFFSVIADAIIAECVRLDGGTQKRCETLIAWSHLMQFMFSNVRDGYYAEMRQQRRSSLPQQRLFLKQGSQCGGQQRGTTTRTPTGAAIGVGERQQMRRERKKGLMMQQGISFDMNI